MELEFGEIGKISGLRFGVGGSVFRIYLYYTKYDMSSVSQSQRCVLRIACIMYDVCRMQAAVCCKLKTR
jgi:hypothetical protein